MHIGFVTFSIAPFGSNDLLFYKAAQQLLRDGHKVTISHDDWPMRIAEYDDIENDGATILKRKVYRRKPSFLLRQYDKLRFVLTDHTNKWRFLKDFDVVVFSDPGLVHMLSASGFADFINASRLKYLTICQYNDENSSIPSAILDDARELFSKATHAVFVSQRNLDVAKRQLCLSLNNACVIHNPPNLCDWSIVPWPASAVPRMAMVARLDVRVKGQALIVDVLAQGKWQSRLWTLDIYGAGPDERFLRELVLFRGLSDRVTFHGYATDVRRIWSNAELLIMASCGEGKPLALTEAMVCGRPAVVTDVGGNAELVENGHSGFVADACSFKLLDDALERAWNSRGDWQVLGENAHYRAVDLLTPMPEFVLKDRILDAAELPPT